MIYEKEWEDPNYKFLSYPADNLNWHIHFHESFEICFVLDGKINIRISDTDYFLKKNDAVIIFPHQLHKYETENQSNLHIITFMGELVPQFTDEYKNLLPKSNDLSGLEKYKDSLYPSNVFMQKGLIYSIMGNFIKDREFEVFSANEETQLLIKVLKFIEKNYTNECSLKTAANELSYGYSYLSRTFKRVMRINYNEYLNRYRINRAMYLLSNEKDMQIQDIALRCGYESLCSFNRNFKDFTGITPRDMISKKITKKNQAHT